MFVVAMLKTPGTKPRTWEHTSKASAKRRVKSLVFLHALKPQHVDENAGGFFVDATSWYTGKRR